MDVKTFEQIKIPLVLIAPQVNIILKALGMMPYAEVADTIAIIKQQGDPAVERALKIATMQPPPSPGTPPVDIPLDAAKVPPAKAKRARRKP